MLRFKFLFMSLILLTAGCAKQQKTSSNLTLDNSLSDETLMRFTNLITNLDGFNNDKNNLYFLILRDCSCVEENIQLIEEFLDSIKASSFFYIKHPYDNEFWRGFKKSLDSSGADYFVDSNQLSESHGLILPNDKCPAL